MKHATTHYQTLNFNGYTWSSFSNGAHYFKKLRKDGLGHWFFLVSDDDIDQGFAEFIAG